MVDIKSAYFDCCFDYLGQRFYTNTTNRITGVFQNETQNGNKRSSLIFHVSLKLKGSVLGDVTRDLSQSSYDFKIVWCSYLRFDASNLADENRLFFPL